MAGLTLNVVAAYAKHRINKELGYLEAELVNKRMKIEGNEHYAKMKQQVAHMKPDFMGSLLLRTFLHSAVLYKAMEEELGPEQADFCFRKIMHPLMRPIFSLSMRPVSNIPNPFEEFKRRYIKANKPLTMMKWKVVESTENTFQADFSVCGLAEAGRAIEMPELTKLYCEYDEVYFNAYDPRLTFIRDEKLADGNDRCTFRFEWDNSAK